MGVCMAEVRSLSAFRKAKHKKQAAGNTLCKSGHHKWREDKTTTFDSKEGRLVTKYVCERCGKSKVKAL